MRRLIAALVLIILVTGGLWFTADTLFPEPYGAQVLSESFTQLSGILAIVMMACAVLLATRPKWLEPTLNGLDKMYRLHKWLAIGALVAALAHWLLRTGVSPYKDGGQGGSNAAAVQNLPDSLHKLAFGLASPGMILLVILIVMALMNKKVSYHLFAKSHQFIVLPFLLLAFHGLVLMKASYWSGVLAWAVAVMVLVGVVACLLALFGGIGRTRKVQGAVASSWFYPELQIFQTSVKLNGTWQGHKAGQFAFLCTSKQEGAHPFTLASDWDPEVGTIDVIAKDLGDYTHQLETQWAPGHAISVEGPYGCFTFDDDKPLQIWIAGGVGITPFVAKMRELAKAPTARPVHLFVSTAEASELAFARLRQDAANARISMQILVSPRDGRLSAARIQEAVPDWKNASIWFCGPAGFGSALKLDFTMAGLAMSDFHQEMFAFR